MTMDGLSMGWGGVPMGDLWPVADGTRPCACGIQSRETVSRDLETPPLCCCVWHGVPMGAGWLVEPINGECRYGM